MRPARLPQMIAAVFVAMNLIVVHRLDGGQVLINPDAITSMHSPMAPGPRKLLIEGAQCAIGLYDGKIISVRESCAQVRRLIHDATRMPTPPQ